MLSFVLGSPGSGKTAEIIRRIDNDLKNGKKVLVIVPEQDVLSSERRISTALGASPELFNLDVVSFRRLSNMVFRACGGLCYNYLDKGGQAIMMWRVLSELSPMLNTYKLGASTDIGLVSSLVSLCDEFADYRVTPIDLEDAVYKLPLDLQPKAEDIATLYTRYDELIHEGFDSAKDDLVKVAELIAENALFCDTNVYIDSFNGFTPAEYEVIKELISSADDLCVSLCIGTDRDTEIFRNLNDTRNRLISVAKDRGIDIGDDTVLQITRSADIAFFEKYCFDSYTDVTYTDEVENITSVTAGDIYTECELVASDIAKQIRSGMHYRDVCVVMGDPSGYKGILDTVFERHDIPYHFSCKDDILQKPIVKLIICALNIITYNWRLQDVISYIKTGFCGITDEECDIIEEYASTWSISGAMWKLDSAWNMNPNGYTDRTSADITDRLVRINEIRDRLREPLIRLADSINGKSSADTAARAIYTFLSECVDIYSLGDDDTACWNALMSALEQLSICGGDIPVGDIETLKRLIRLLTSQTDFSLIPATIDEVNCISLSSLKSAGLKKCYIIGAIDGSFPSVFKENNILNDELRTALCENDLNLPHDPDELQYDQLWLFWRGVLSADKVWISRHTGTLDGKEVLPSSCVYELERLFPKLVTKTEKDFGIYDLIYDKASAFDRITDKAIGSAVREVLSDDREYADSIKALSVPISTTLCSVTDPENLKIFEGDINLTQTRVDSYVHCKFAYQLDYVLKLNEQRKVSYDPRDVGTFIHALLEEFFTCMRDAAKEGKNFTDKEIEDTVTRIVEAYIERTCGDVLTVSKRMQALFKRLRRQALIFVRSIYDEFENSDFEPVLFEVSISNNNDDAISPFRVELSDGSGVYIYGQIDRVDTYEKDGNVYFRVVDYKTGKKVFKRSDLERGLNLQMFLYMFSIMENKEKFCDKLGCQGELVPAGVLYYIARLPSSSHDVLLNAEQAEIDVIEHIERQGMLLDDPDIIRAMSKADGDIPLPKGITTGTKANAEDSVYTVESLNEIKNTISETLMRIGMGLKTGKADAQPMKDSRSPCEYCRMRPVCRRLKDGGVPENE